MQTPNPVIALRWSRNLKRTATVFALTFMLVYGSDIILTVHADRILGLRRQTALQNPRAWQPWAYVPVQTPEASLELVAEQGDPVFESHPEPTDLANNDLYRKVQQIRKRLDVSLLGVRIGPTVYVPLRRTAPLVGAQVEWAGGQQATVFSPIGLLTLTADRKHAQRNYNAITLPEAPTILNGEFLLPLSAVAKIWSMELRQDPKTGVRILSGKGRTLRILVDQDAYYITISRSGRWVQVSYAGHFVKRYGACTGMGDNTPVGDFHVQNKAVWPGWRAYWGEYIPGGDPRNPLGARWLGTTARGRATRRVIGIHGTNDPSSIGQRISGGCVRVLNRHAIELYEVVPLGTRVSIRE